MDDSFKREGTLPGTPFQRLMFFFLTVSGFSFWFLIGVPFASHRESYWWLAYVWRDSLIQSVINNSSTWRPLAQLTTWLGFIFLNPRVFPTSTFRQAILQGSVYLLFVIGWAMIYSAVREKKIFALISLVVGGVFFSAYVPLFHIYGVFYVPVLLMLAIMLRLTVYGGLEKKETALAVVAVILTFWHPFATAMFAGFYFGYYVTNFWTFAFRRHLKIWVMLGASAAAILVPIALSSNTKSTFKFLGFLTTYRTNEVNLIASVVALLLCYVTVASTPISLRGKILPIVLVTLLGIGLITLNIPVLLLWVLTTACKLLYVRNWQLLVPLLVAAALPFGAGLGAPIYALFVMILCVVGTAMDWKSVEQQLIHFKPQYAAAAMAALLIVVVGMRSGASVPVVSSVARPLLAERERTYQLEHTLSWLATSDYCGYEIAFAEDADNPVADVESATNRRFRPPATFSDVDFFWNTVLRCKRTDGSSKPTDIAVITFGGSQVPDSTSIFELPSPNAGPTTVWIQNDKNKVARSR